MRRLNLSLTGLVLVLASACTDADRSMLILQNQVPDGCTPAATSGGTFRPRGRIDVQSGQGYLFFPVVQNNTEGGDNVASHLLQVQGADVELSFQEGFFAEGEITEDIQRFLTFSERFSGVIEPNGGLTSFAFVIVPKGLLEAVEATGKLTTDGRNSVAVLAKVTMFGTLDGGDVTSQPYEYVVDMCDGCLLVSVGACSELPPGFSASQGGECNPLQDSVLECCVESDGDARCPASIEAEL